METAPEGEAATADAKKKFKTRSNKALSMIVLFMKPELHYLIGREPDDPVAVWKQLTDHSECKLGEIFTSCGSDCSAFPRCEKSETEGQ